MPSIRLESVGFAYLSSAPPVLADVDLHLVPGFTGIVGDNGAGKTTLLSLITRKLTSTHGRVLREPRDLLFAHCPQEIDEVVDIVPDAGRWYARLGLEEDQPARWPTLSPGERRRWQLASALASEPDVLLLDEPTNHVDAACRRIVLGALRRFHGIGLV